MVMSNANIFAVVEEAVARITYKPGWKIRCQPGPGNLPPEVAHLIEFRIVGTVSEVQTQIVRTGTLTFEEVNWRDDYDAIDEFIYRYVFDLIQLAEMHELYEFFKIDGINYRDPHPELGRDRNWKPGRHMKV
jgi:hypothetical protein